MSISLNMETVQSFDVFDTIVTRDVYRPSDLFYFVGKSLRKNRILDIDPFLFQRLRIEAERLARKMSQYEEVTFDEIYEALSTVLDLGEDQIKSLKETEIRLEKEAMIPISENFRKISEKTILTSDTYFDGKTLADFLRSVGVNTYKEMYVSSEYRKTKRSGRLYETITKKYCVEKHVGDNKESDFKVPQKNGYLCHTVPGKLALAV